jgi:protein-tyrosine phosphatase
MWRSGHALRPYFRDVQMLVRNKAMFPDLQGYNIVDEDDLTFVHFPIRDCGVTDDGRVLELARSLVQAISEGEVIYLHCWGGHGRTGTLVCIMLHLMYGVSVDMDSFNSMLT